MSDMRFPYDLPPGKGEAVLSAGEDGSLSWSASHPEVAAVLNAHYAGPDWQWVGLGATGHAAFAAAASAFASGPFEVPPAPALPEGALP